MDNALDAAIHAMMDTAEIEHTSQRRMAGQPESHHVVSVDNRAVMTAFMAAFKGE